MAWMVGVGEGRVGSLFIVKSPAYAAAAAAAAAVVCGRGEGNEETKVVVLCLRAWDTARLQEASVLGPNWSATSRIRNGYVRGGWQLGVSQSDEGVGLKSMSLRKCTSYLCSYL
jgi:hypothetical protein